MKILIRLPNWLGDVVMSTAFINAVREFYPDAVLHVVIKKELYDIAGLITGIDQIHSFSKKEFPGLPGVYRFGRQLRKFNYDLFFCLPDSLSSALMGWATGAVKRVGYGKEGRFFLLTDSYKKERGRHRADEYLFLAEKFTGNTALAPRVRIDIPEKTETGPVIVNFNSEASSRRMPAHKAMKILKSLADAFPGHKFGLIGSPKERPFIDSLFDADDNRFVNFAGKTSLAELAVLIASARVMLTTDSGPAHLANALGVPTIALFGAGNELNTAPYNQSNLKVIRAEKLSCEPCVKNTCELYGQPKCMELLDELQIINTLSVYLPHA